MVVRGFFVAHVALIGFLPRNTNGFSWWFGGPIVFFLLDADWIIGSPKFGGSNWDSNRGIPPTTQTTKPTPFVDPLDFYKNIRKMKFKKLRRDPSQKCCVQSPIWLAKSLRTQCHEVMPPNMFFLEIILSWIPRGMFFLFAFALKGK